jgi:hypothetical protein
MRVFVCARSTGKVPYLLCATRSDNKEPAKDVLEKKKVSDRSSFTLPEIACIGGFVLFLFYYNIDCRNRGHRLHVHCYPTTQRGNWRGLPNSYVTSVVYGKHDSKTPRGLGPYTSTCLTFSL